MHGVIPTILTVISVLVFIDWTFDDERAARRLDYRVVFAVFWLLAVVIVGLVRP